jgi:hypothetical protein
VSVIIAIVLALAAVGATPAHEDTRFIADILTTCVPHVEPDFIGCDLPAAPYTSDELGYAGWSHGEPITGP